MLKGNKNSNPGHHVPPPACLLSANRPEGYYDKEGEKAGLYNREKDQDVNSNEVGRGREEEGEEGTKPSLPLHHRLSAAQVPAALGPQ